MEKSRWQFLAALALAAATLPAQAKLAVFACEPEWAALAAEIGGSEVLTYSATTALQDPHRVEARPSLIARVRSADLVICTGAQLEIGWLPVLLTQAGNTRVQPGTQGFLETSRYVAKLEVPQSVDRALGDIHPAGNPHIQTDPRNIARVAEVLTARMAELDPANAVLYRSRSSAFLQRWQAAIARWESEGASLKGTPVVVHHKAWSYLENWLGLREVGTLEPLPGVPPTPGHLAELVEAMRRTPAKLIIYSSYDDPKAAEFLSARTGIPTLMLPFTVGGSPRAKDLFGYFDDILARLKGAIR